MQKRAAKKNPISKITAEASVPTFLSDMLDLALKWLYVAESKMKLLFDSKIEYLIKNSSNNNVPFRIWRGWI